MLHDGILERAVKPPATPKMKEVSFLHHKFIQAINQNELLTH
jgi:hypothetical protein